MPWPMGVIFLGMVLLSKLLCIPNNIARMRKLLQFHKMSTAGLFL